MKKTVKKAFAALTAALMLGTAATAPVNAADTLKNHMLGDVDMDGVISLEDAVIALKEYTYVTLYHEEHVLTGEQFALAKVCQNEDAEIHMNDAWGILVYYTNKTLFNQDINWKTLWGEAFFTAHIAEADRGDYELIFDEAAGEYVIAKKG
jgi:hypothetical protein